MDHGEINRTKCKRSFPGGIVGKEFTCWCRRCQRLRFSPWVGKIPWSRKWQPTPIFLPGKFHGQRSLAGATGSPWSCIEQDMPENTLIYWNYIKLLDKRPLLPSVEKSVALNGLGLSLVRTDLRIVPNKKGISTRQWKLILLFQSQEGKCQVYQEHHETRPLGPWERVLLLMFSTVPSHSLTCFRNTAVFVLVKIIL